MANFIGGIIAITIGLIVFSNVFMPTVHGTNTSTWSASEVSLWNTVGLIGVVGILYAVLNIFGIM